MNGGPWDYKEPEPGTGRARRAAWIRSHPVLGSLVVGAGTGLLIALIEIVLFDDEPVRTVVGMLLFGVLLFGPFVVWRIRNQGDPAGQ